MSNPSPNLPPIEIIDGGIRLRLRVQPKASRNAIKVDNGGRIRLAVTASPTEGAANTMAVAYLADTLGVAKRQVRLVSGEKSRDKAFDVKGMDAETVRGRLGA